MVRISIFLLIILFVSGEQIPEIKVLTESLCVDCGTFVSEQLKHFLNYGVLDLANITFIPFGNAKEEYDEETKQWKFTCQHQENECYGNMIETCIINIQGQIPSYTTLLCIEENMGTYWNDFDITLAHCISSEELIKEIMDCVHSDLGNKYQHEMAQRTPEHDYVPWIIFNGEHNKEIEDKILNNMLQFLCSLQPEKCKNPYFESNTYQDIKK